MTIEQHTFNVLRANAGVTALCPESRIKVPGDWQNLAAPYIIHFPVALEPITAHDGLKSLRIWDYYQVSVFAATYSTGRALVNAIIAALPGVHGTVQYTLRPGTFWVGQDADVSLHHFVLNFRVAESLGTSPA